MIEGRAPHAPGDALLHPAALAGVALLIVNDHLLKAQFPGFVTGKLSDIAGLSFFPLLLVGAWELVAVHLGRTFRPTSKALATALLTTAIAFVAAKTLPDASAALGGALGFAQAGPAIAIALGRGDAIDAIQVAPVATDPSDLLAVPALGIALAVGAKRVKAR